MLTTVDLLDREELQDRCLVLVSSSFIVDGIGTSILMSSSFRWAALWCVWGERRGGAGEERGGLSVFISHLLVVYLGNVCSQTGADPVIEYGVGQVTISIFLLGLAN